jgi:hypothetical protein
MASKDSQMSKQGTVSKGKHGTSTIPQKLKIIRRPESAKNGRGTLASCYVGSSTVHKKEEQKDHLQLFIASSESV